MTMIQTYLNSFSQPKELQTSYRWCSLTHLTKKTESIQENTTLKIISFAFSLLFDATIGLGIVATLSYNSGIFLCNSYKKAKQLYQQYRGTHERLWNKTALKTWAVIGTVFALSGVLYYFGTFEAIKRWRLSSLPSDSNICSGTSSSWRKNEMKRLLACLGGALFLKGIATYIDNKKCWKAEEFSAEIRAKFPPDFLHQIRRSNEEKPYDAPNALILAAESHLNESITFPSSLFFFFNVAKTHRVAFHVIRSKNDIRAAIQRQKNLNHRPIQSLFFNAHGNSSCIQLGMSELYTSTDVKSEDFEGLAADANIFFTSCKAGSENENGLAQTIANITDRIVFATPRVFAPTQSCFSFCDTHHIFETFAFHEGKQHILRFQKGKQPFACNHSRQSMALYFSEMHDYFRKYGKPGDCPTLLEEGNLSLEEGDPVAAKFWYKKAAEKGCSWTQLLLGTFSEEERDLPAAKFWYEKAADQGHADAQYYLGMLFYNEHDWINAKFWLEKAAAQEHQEAQRNLDRLRAKEESSVKP